jgi:tetratricopeptide (TPR) repeat protein
MRACEAKRYYSSAFYGWLLAIALSLSLQASMQAQAGLTAGESVDVFSAGTAASGDMATISQAPPQLSLEEKGDALSASGHYLAAIKAYSEISQPSAALWNKMGMAYQLVYDLKDAVRCYRESLKLQPANAYALNNLGTVDDLQLNFPAAERDYRKALKLRPNDAHALRNLGNNLLMQREYDKSADAYQRALAIDPHVLDPHYGRQVEVLGAGQALGPGNYVKARSCAREGLTDCALAYLERAFNEGSATAKKVADDADFASLRDTPAMARLLARQQ